MQSDKSNPLLSVVTPVRDDIHVERTLNSILSGINCDTEVRLILNNPSSEVTAISDVFSKSGILIDQYDNPLSLGDIRNYGIEVSLGKYIIHVDSDCILDPAYFEAMKIAIEENPDGHVFVPSLFRHPGTNPVSRVMAMHFYRTNNNLGGRFFNPGLCISKELHKDFPFSPIIKWGDDRYFMAALKDFNVNVVRVPDAHIVHKADDTEKVVAQLFRYGFDKGKIMEFFPHSDNLNLRLEWLKNSLRQCEHEIQSQTSLIEMFEKRCREIDHYACEIEKGSYIMDEQMIEYFEEVNRLISTLGLAYYLLNSRNVTPVIENFVHQFRETGVESLFNLVPCGWIPQNYI